MSEMNIANWNLMNYMMSILSYLIHIEHQRQKAMQQHDWNWNELVISLDEENAEALFSYILTNF